jgi:hypothetical protein
MKMFLPARSANAKRPFRGWAKILLMAASLWFALSHNAQAACNLTATQTSALSYGTWQQPSSGSQTADVTTADAVSGTGTKLYGTTVHGVFSLTSNNAQCTGTLTINLTDTAGVAGITLSNFHLVYNGGSIANGATGLVLPTSAGKTLLVGATITYTSAVTVGAKSPTFNIQMTDSGTGATKANAETATISLDVPVTIAKVSDIDFGTVKTASSVYTMSTAGAISATGSGAYLTGTTSAGNLTIGGSTTSTVTISVGNYQANGGPTPSNAKGAYNGGAAASFPMTVAAPGGGKTLLLGVDLTATGSEATNTTFTPSFDVTVAYP